MSIYRLGGGLEGGKGEGFITSPSLKPVETWLAVTSIHLKLPANKPGFRFPFALSVNTKLGEWLAHWPLAVSQNTPVTC